MSALRVAALRIYPVKACAALALDDAALGPLGLEHDRRFAFVDRAGLALTQRDQPLLATVRPTLERDALRLDFGALFDLQVPFAAFSENAVVDVWGKRIAARAAPESALAQGEEYLGTTLRLVMLDAGAPRAFVDSQPVLVTTTAMLARLNALLSQAVGMERFRPNVVLEGDDAPWRRLRGQQTLLESAKPCGRCEVTTIDQASGERRGDEPLRMLNARFDGNFGVYCTVARAGRLRVGETLEAGSRRAAARR